MPAQKNSAALTRRGFVVSSVGAAAALSFRHAWGKPPEGPPYHADDAARSPFNMFATAEEVTEGLDLSGKTILLTGSSSGIGFETLRVLVLRGAHVLAFAPTLEKAQQACAKVTGDGFKGTATPFGCDQTDYDAVVSASNAVKALEVPLDILICNAGLGAAKLEQVRGIDKIFAVNHLSHFILVNRLLERVKAAPQGRVVVVSSIAHLSVPPAGIDFGNLSGEHVPYDGGAMYAQSKLANGLFSRELARRLHRTTTTSNTLHPGSIPNTNFHNFVQKPKDRPAVIPAKNPEPKFIGSELLKSIEQGAATQCYVATHPSLAKVSGAYFLDCHIAVPGSHMQDDDLARKLWKVSEHLTRPFLERA